MKLDPWGSTIVKDYQRLFDEFGIRRFKPASIPAPHQHMRRGFVFGQRDFAKIANSIKGKKPYAMLTGLMPSGKFHFGHKILADQFPWYQKNGAEVFIAVADIEAYAVRRIPMARLRMDAVSQYLLNYIALGLKPKNCHFYFQSDYQPVYYKLSKMVSANTTSSELQAIYGPLTPGKITSALLQVADILHPQLREFGGKRPVVVPVGTDQDPHIRLTRGIAQKCDFDFLSPSSTYHKFQMGLDGGKMSSSRPMSLIALSDPAPLAVAKLRAALTGGRDTKAEQEKKGGQPEKCVVYEFLAAHLVSSDKQLADRYADCKAGKILCGECKQDACGRLKAFLASHQKKLKSAKKKVPRFLK